MAYDFNNPVMIEQMRDPDTGSYLGYAPGTTPTFEDFLSNGQIDWNKVEQFSRSQGWIVNQPFDAKNKAIAVNNITAMGGVNGNLRNDPAAWAQYGIPEDVIQSQFGILQNQEANASGSGLFGSTFDSLFDQTQSFVDQYALPIVGAGLGAMAMGAGGAAGSEAGAAAGAVETGLSAELAAGAPELAEAGQWWVTPSTPVGSSMGFDAASVDAAAAAAQGSGVLPTAAGLSPGTTAAISGGAAAVPSLYDRLTGGNAQNADYLELLGRVAPAALGAYASNQQANSLENIANKYAEYGAPSRARYEGSFAPGFTMASDPGYQDALDQSASAAWRAGSMGGNPAGNPAALSEILDRLYKGTAYPALQNYRTGNASAGGIASGTAAAPSLDQSAIGARTNVYNAFGAGIADVMNKPKSLAEQFSDLRRMGIV